MTQECELCGQQRPTRLYRIESAEVMACVSCGRYGTLLLQNKDLKVKNAPQITNTHRPRRKTTYNTYRKPLGDIILIEDYGTIISRSRENIGLSRKELAESLFIRETLLIRIETGKVRPSDSLIKKLEKTLEVKLMEASGQDQVSVSQYQTGNYSRSRTMTLGDFAKIKKSKSK